MYSGTKRAVFIWALLSILVIAIIISTIADQSSIPPNYQPPNTSQALLILHQLEVKAHKSGLTSAERQQLGDALFALGDARSALAHWLAAGLIEASHQRRIAQVSISLQEWTIAQDALQHILTVAPNDTWAHYQLGLIRAAFQPQQAIKHLRQAASDSAYHNNATQLLSTLLSAEGINTASFRVGTTFIELGLWPYAELAMRHAADLNYPDPIAIAYVGLARDYQAKDGSAWITEAVERAPNLAEVRYIQGLHLRAKGELIASASAFDLAVNIEPENPAYYAELGIAYQLLNDLPRAEFWLKEAVRASGNRLAFQRLLADFYAQAAPELGLDPISRLLEPSSALPNGDAEMQSSYGWALHITGNSEDGLAEITAALAIDPNNPKILYDKARLLLDIGDVSAAIPIFQDLASGATPYATQAKALLDGLLNGGQ